jgi:hypothetical protein
MSKRRQNAYNTLETIIRKLERWQNKYPELDEESEAEHAKSKLMRIWRELR